VVQRDPEWDSVGRGAGNRPVTAGPDETNPASGEGTRTQVVVTESVAVESPQLPKKFIKLVRYDGSNVPFETFVSKLNNATSYNRRSENEKCVFLRDALIGEASQIFWELKSDASSEEIISLLRIRYGNANNSERSRAEFWLAEARQVRPGLYRTLLPHSSEYNILRTVLLIYYISSIAECVG